MNPRDSKGALLYGQVRRALRSGRYAPGQRIDPAMLAAEFSTSVTPVRFALYRLVGEELLEDHGRSGLHVPLPTEVALRELYDGMERLLQVACDVGVSRMPRGPARELKLPTPEDDLVKVTWQLFDAIAGATSQRWLHRTVKRTNDQLAPIRRAKQQLLENGFDELDELIRHWHLQDVPALRIALHDYHERRKQLVPCIVATLMERRNHLY